MPTFLDRVGAAWSALTGGSSPSSPTRAGDHMSRAARLAVSGVTPGPRVDKHPIVLGPNVTPALLAVALRHAEQGRMRRLCDLCSEMRETVPHMQSELGKREKALTRYPVVILPADTKGQGARAEKRAKKIADYVRMRVSSIRGFSDGIEHLQGAVYQGRSALEKELFRDKDGIGIRRFHPVSPKRLSYAENWRIHLYDEAGHEDSPLGHVSRHRHPRGVAGQVHHPRAADARPGAAESGRASAASSSGPPSSGSTTPATGCSSRSSSRTRCASLATRRATDKAEDIDFLKQEMIELSGLTSAVYPEGCKPRVPAVRPTVEDAFATFTRVARGDLEGRERRNARDRAAR
jgi:hypothetical protein